MPHHLHLAHSRMPLAPACVPAPRDSAEKFAGRPCLGWRTKQGLEGKLGPYSFMTYKEAWDKAVKVASGCSAHVLDSFVRSWGCVASLQCNPGPETQQDSWLLHCPVCCQWPAAAGRPVRCSAADMSAAR